MIEMEKIGLTNF